MVVRVSTVAKYLMSWKAVLFISLFYLSCTNERPVLFEINAESEFVISPGLDNLQTFTWTMNNIPTRIGIISNARDEDLIEGIFANRAEVKAPFVNFDFTLINSVVINIWEPGKREDKKEVFFMDQFNNRNKERLQLFSSLSEVKDILLNDTFDAEIRIRFRAFTPTEIKSQLTMNFVAHGKR